jgi:hypothetical protein
VTRRTTLSLLLAACSVVLSAAGLGLLVLNWPLPLVYAEWGFPGFQAIAALVFAGVASVVSLRRPGNPIGWLLQFAGVFSAVQFLGHQYALYGLVKAPGSVPAPSVGTWIEEWIWLPILGAMGIFMFLLFPTGRLIGPRWRPVAWAAIVSIVAGMVGFAFGPPVRVPGAVNPLVGDQLPASSQPLAYVGASGAAVVLAIAAASIVIRFRRSTGVERQQLKWLALGALIVSIGLGIQTSITLAGGDAFGIAAAITSVTLLAVPLAIALAMLRYGLYEVDRVLNRTVVYALVSVVLLGVYGATVLVLQPVLHPVTGGDTLAVAGSTLLVATAFQPVRRRVQEAVDRRFFRSRYDAGRTVERLGARLRDEVDLDTLADALLTEVRQAIQPSGASIWLRGR